MRENDNEIGRRQYLLMSTTVVCCTGLAGCSEEDNNVDGTEPQGTEDQISDTTETETRRTEDETNDDTTNILIEYDLSDPRTHEEVPEEVIEHPNPEGFFWIVVEFELITGQFNASDIMGLTQVREDNTGHFTRAVIITSPDERTLTAPEDEYMMTEGTTGKVYYRLSEEPDNPEWVIQQLRNKHGTVEIRKA